VPAPRFVFNGSIFEKVACRPPMTMKIFVHFVHGKTASCARRTGRSACATVCFQWGHFWEGGMPPAHDHENLCALCASEKGWRSTKRFGKVSKNVELCFIV